MYTKLLKSHHSHHNAKATVARDDLYRTMNGFCHVKQRVDRLQVPHPLLLAREGPSPVSLVWTGSHPSWSTFLRYCYI